MKMMRPGASTRSVTALLAWIAMAAVPAGVLAQSYEQLFAEAHTLSANGDYGQAARKYEAALRLRPNAPEAMSNAGVMYYMAGRFTEAESILEKALKVQPDLASANLIRGLSLVRLARFADAIHPLERLLARDPGHRDAVLGLASARVALGQLEEAADLYRQQTHRSPRDADAWHGLALCYERLAEAHSRRLSALPNGAAYVRRLLGEYWMDRGQFRLAYESLAEALAIDPGQPGLLTLVVSARAGKPPDTIREPDADSPVAVVYLETRRLAGLSREAFARFVEIAPNSWQAQLFLGDISRQRREFKQAIQHYENAARQKPDSPAPFVGLGTVYWELADDDLAIENLERATRIAPENVQALFALGNIAVKQRRDSEALVLLKECLRLYPDHRGAHAELGKAYLHLDRLDDAVPHLEQALAIDTYGDIHFQLGQALRKLGREQESAQAFDRSREIRREQLQREQRLRLGKD